MTAEEILAQRAEQHQWTWLYSGSFDPITLGHLEIIERASRLCDRLIVGVGVNAEKHYLFNMEERERLVRESVDKLPNVEVARIPGLTIDYAFENHVAVLVRGVRDGNDLAREMQIAAVNEEMHWSVETVLIPGRNYSHVSSSALKELWKLGATEYQLATMAPAHVVSALLKKRVLMPI